MSTWNHVAAVLGFALGLLFVLRLLQERRQPSVTLSWLLGVVVAPYLVVPLFLLFSGRKLRRRIRGKCTLARAGGQRIEGSGLSPDLQRLLDQEGAGVLRPGCRVELLTDGVEAHRALLELIDSARERIHLMTFILGRDEVGREVVERLAARAAAGVQVRVLVDALGSFWTSGNFLEPLRLARAEVATFLPVLPLHRRWSANLRNHRKLLIVDGERAWTGGRNLALEYLGPTPREERWVDLSALVRGPLAADLECVFADDWSFATGRQVPVLPVPAPAGQDRAQVVASGPDLPGDPLSDAVLTAVSEARHRIWIVTPYFVPDDPIGRALALAARKGRDVRLVLPERSNHALADVVRTRYLHSLAEDGVHVLLVPGPMLHAKAMVFDDELGLFGSANLDLRSLYLNFELSILLHGGPALDSLVAWLEDLARDARPWESRRPNLRERVLADVAGLAAPLL